MHFVEIENLEHPSIHQLRNLCNIPIKRISSKKNEFSSIFEKK